MKINLFIVKFLLAFSIIGCKDASIPAAIGPSIAQVKGLAMGDRLPESKIGDAIANHGFQKLLTWAEEGDRKAQHFVAVAYLDGSVVTKNFNASEKWALRAANQGSPASQYLIGMIRANEAKTTSNLLQLEPNLILAYMWFSVAAVQGNEPAKEMRDRIQSSMDPRWVTRAQEMAANWRPCNDRSCWDTEPKVGPPTECKDQPNSVFCIAGIK